MSDKDFLTSIIDQIGEENLRRLLTLTSEKCISELNLGTSENCKQKGVCDNNICIDCILNSLKKNMSIKHKPLFRFLSK